MDFFTAMDVSAQGLSTQRVRMNVAASNLANVDSVGYQRKTVMVQSVPFGDQARGVSGVMVKQIVSAPLGRPEYEPDNPNADADGNVTYPDISPVTEMVDMITASRAYEAGVTAMSTSVSMAERALGIGR